MANLFGKRITSCRVRAFCLEHHTMHEINAIYEAVDMPYGVYALKCADDEEAEQIPNEIYTSGLYYEARLQADNTYLAVQVLTPPTRQKVRKIKVDNRPAILRDALRHLGEGFIIVDTLPCSRCGAKVAQSLVLLNAPYEGYAVVLCDKCQPHQQTVTLYRRDGTQIERGIEQ